jgi:cephalosporin hydroxylase/predicted SAM-dependent methyltransferase
MSWLSKALRSHFGSRQVSPPESRSIGVVQPPVEATRNNSLDALEAEIRRLIQVGKPVDAMKIARQAASGHGNTPGTSFLYGLSLESVGRHEEALEAYQAELTVNPKHTEARIRCEHLLKALAKPVVTRVPTEQRSWHTSLPRPTLLTMQQSLHNYQYRSVPMLKNPFDAAIYPQLLWNLKPRTIFEIGSKYGGSALWMGDLLDNFRADARIYSLDIVKVTNVSHPRVTFLEGDGRALEKSFSPDFLQNQPKPWLVIEDADHTYETSSAVLKFFHPWLGSAEYIVVEDGIISDLTDDPECNSGPHRALKEFLKEHPDEYEIDGDYCDLFGYNMTWCTNGFLKKKTDTKTDVNEAAPMQEARQLLKDGKSKQALSLLNQFKARRIPIRNVDMLRAECFLDQQLPEAALEAAKEELRHFPENKDAAALIEKLEADIPPVPVPGNEEFQKLHSVISHYTMVGPLRLLSLYDLGKSICERDVPGNFVECGVAAGGTSALLASVIKLHSKRNRSLYSCDTFTGLPDVSPFDKHAGVNAQDMGWGAGTCSAPSDSLRKVCEKLGVMDIVEPVEGLFADTLPKIRGHIGPIAFLHMDGDWYSSTRDILENLFDQVVDGGVIQIDDYGYWEGCKQAIEEFEEKRGVDFDLYEIDGTGVWMIKNDSASNAGSGVIRAQSVRPLRLLNLGCGAHFHPSWVNVDINPNNSQVLKHDLQTRLPFEDDSFGAVYHSHVLEHLPRRNAAPFLKECYRVLARGGIMRVVVPDLETIARLYLKYLDGSLNGDKESIQRHEWMTLELLDQMVREQSGGEMLKYWQRNPMPAEDFVIERMGQEVRRYRAHLTANPVKFQESLPPPDETQIARFRQSGEIHKWMYDHLSLRVMLEGCGFREVSVCTPNGSRIPDFGSYHLDITGEGSIRKPDSLFMEALKP